MHIRFRLSCRSLFFFPSPQRYVHDCAFHPFHLLSGIYCRTSLVLLMSLDIIRERTCDIFCSKRSNKKWKNSQNFGFFNDGYIFFSINVRLTVSGSTEVWVMVIRFTSESSIVWSMTRHCSFSCETRIFSFVKQTRIPTAFECLKICVLLKWDCDTSISCILE